MAEHHPTDRATDSGPRPSPQTDPTNPHRQEAAGVWVLNERANERRVDEVGLTDRDRDERSL
jgi:hypothetical protein